MIKKVLKKSTQAVSKFMYEFSLLKNTEQSKNMVDSEEKLEGLISEIKDKKEVAVDIEGDSLYSNQLKICLIQFSTREKDFIVDPLKIKNISSLNEVFIDPKIEKILHGSYYDILLLHKCAGIQVKNLFDTQIAACFIGESKTGLASLVEKYFNVKLEKKYQKSNWAIRPLPECMLEYAIMDTRYLLPLADRLKEKLIKRNRLDWVKEESECMTVEIIRKKEGPLSKQKKIKSRNFEKNCERLNFWRKCEAERLNIAPHLILSKKQICALSEKKPSCLDEVLRMNCLKKWQKNAFGKKIYFLLSEL